MTTTVIRPPPRAVASSRVEQENDVRRSPGPTRSTLPTHLCLPRSFLLAGHIASRQAQASNCTMAVSPKRQPTYSIVLVPMSYFLNFMPAQSISSAGAFLSPLIFPATRMNKGKNRIIISLPFAKNTPTNALLLSYRRIHCAYSTRQHPQNQRHLPSIYLEASESIELAVQICVQYLSSFHCHHRL